MIILGIDPGVARIGWAILQVSKKQIQPLAYGLITTDKNTIKEKRLSILYSSMTVLIKKYSPDVMSVEDLFFANNAKTAIAVGEARGVILLSAAQKNIPVVSYTPLTVKRTITGNGQADKKQVEKMILQLFHLPEGPNVDDTIDAIAIAATHAYTHTFIAHGS